MVDSVYVKEEKYYPKLFLKDLFQTFFYKEVQEILFFADLEIPPKI